MVARLGKMNVIFIILFAAVILIWVGSYSRSPPWGQKGRLLVFASRGEACIRLVPERQPSGAMMDSAGWVFHGFGVYRLTYAAGDINAVDLPLWFLALLFAVPPAFAIRRIRKELRLERWQREGRCVVCGYDLRGSTTTCPECGHPIIKQQASAEN